MTLPSDILDKKPSNCRILRPSYIP